MEWEWKIRITDIIMIIAIIIGPIIAVQITEYLRNQKDSLGRKVHIFRTLMATRSAQLAEMHIEALNLVELEFQASPHRARRVVDAGRLYIDHLKDHLYPRETWDARKNELLVDLLYEMSTALGYNFDKVQIKAGSYYPSGYQETENDNFVIRKLWLDILKGNKQFPTLAQIITASSPTKGIDKKQEEEKQEIGVRS